MQGSRWLGAALALAWLAGVALTLQWAVLPSPAAQCALWAGAGVSLVGALAGAAMARRASAGAGRQWSGRRAVASALAMLATLMLGLVLSMGQAQLRLADALSPELEGLDLQLTGVVSSLPQQRSNGLGFDLAVETAQRGGQPVGVPSLVSLSWTAGRDEDPRLSPLAALRAGDRWQLAVRLRAPHGNANPGGWDAELQWFERGVRATGSVRTAPPPQLLAHGVGWPVQRWRQTVRDAIQAQVPEARVAGLLAALAVGDQSAIEREDWEVFRNTGVAHLVSISGLHVTLFAALAGWALRRLWCLSPRAMLRWPAPGVQRWGGAAAALAYAVVSGWGVPSQRTVWMLLTATLLRSAGRHLPWPVVLLVAAVGVTVFDPWALLQPGFWLSFMAVGLLMASEPATRSGQAARAPAGPADGGVSPPPDPPRWRAGLSRAAHRAGPALRAAWRTQWLATVGLAPLTLVVFQQLSLVGLLANAVAIPVVTGLITPLALLGLWWAPLWSVGAWVSGGLMAGLALLSAWPAAVWTVPAAPGWAQAAGLVAAALLVLPLPGRLRLWAVPLLMPLWWPPVVHPAAGEFELLAADVGQGTAVLVRTREHLLVYDAGPQYAPDSDAGQRVLLPLLRWRGERRIDVLLLSHRDTDHVGGARALLAGLPVGELLSSIEPEHPLWALAPRARRCETGQRWVWDGVQFEVLHPGPEVTAHWRPNATSCVLRVQSAHGASALLTGDIEAIQELAMVGRFGSALRSDVLLVPHHGSHTSSTAPFLEAVQAQVAVVQSGYRNRFGHPVAEVVARLKAQAGVLHGSPACGAWQWQSADASRAEPEPVPSAPRAANRPSAVRADRDAGAPQRDFSPTRSGACWRPQTRRYWHHDLRDFSDDGP
jgi:competence protein ComEC